MGSVMEIFEGLEAWFSQASVETLTAFTAISEVIQKDS